MARAGGVQPERPEEISVSAFNPNFGIGGQLGAGAIVGNSDKLAGVEPLAGLGLIYGSTRDGHLGAFDFSPASYDRQSARRRQSTGD